jgi:hypothetical protein
MSGVLLYVGVTFCDSKWEYITNSTAQLEQNNFPSELESANYFVASIFSQSKQTV